MRASAYLSKTGKQLIYRLNQGSTQRWAMALIVGLGWLLRLRAYWFNRSLWMDEAALAINVIQLDLADLLTKPLLHGQSAPVGFLAATKLLVLGISESEKVLRLVPLGAGLLAVAVAAWVGTLLFEKGLPRVVFTALVAFSPILVYYSTEFKQFILDVFLAMLILGMGLHLQRSIAIQGEPATKSKQTWAMVGLGVAGVIGVWFSQTVVFFLFAVGASLFWQTIRAKRRNQSIGLAAIGIAWLASFGLSISLMLKNVANKGHLFDFWEAGFAPGLSEGLNGLIWYMETGLAAVFLAFRETTVSGPYDQSAWYGWPNILLGMICLGGGLWVILRCKTCRMMLILPGVAAWMTAYLGLYALRGRLFLFIVPLVFIAAAGAVDILGHKKAWVLQWLVGLGLVGIVLIPSARYFARPVAFSEIRNVLPRLVEEITPGSERVAVSQWSLFAYQYYDPRFGLKYLGQPMVISYDFNVADFLGSVCSLPERGKMWLVFSHRMPEARQFLAALAERTPLLSKYEHEGAGIYLFDFSGPGICSGP